MLQPRLPDLRLTGATVLRDGALQERTVAIAGGRIAGGPFPVVDLSGCYVLPGIVDLHGTMPIGDGAIAAADSAAATAGITTGWIAQGWSWPGGSDCPEHAERMMAAHAAHRHRLCTDLRLQITYETHAVDSADRLLAAVRRFGIDQVVLVNSLDHADTPQARAGSRDVPRSLCRLAEAFDAAGVTYASRGEADGEAREFFSAIGARICLCPAAYPAASVAKAIGEPVLMPARDILCPGSGVVSTLTLIRAGKCAGLVSDGHPAAMAQAAFALVDQGVTDLPRAWAMISSLPARIMRLTDRGEIAPGKRADLVIVDKSSRRIEGAIVAGHIAWLGDRLAQRFPGGSPVNIAAE